MFEQCIKNMLASNEFLTSVSQTEEKNFVISNLSMVYTT